MSSKDGRIIVNNSEDIISDYEKYIDQIIESSNECRLKLLDIESNNDESLYSIHNSLLEISYLHENTITDIKDSIFNLEHLFPDLNNLLDTIEDKLGL